MPHTISGLIRKDVFTKQGSTSNGQYKMYALELSESFMPRQKPKDGEEKKRVYTNYRAVLFAKTPGMIKYYDDVLKKDNFVVINCDNLQLIIRETESGTFSHLEMIDAKLHASHSAAGTGTANQSAAQASGANNSSSGGWGSPSGSNEASGASGESSGGKFEDDIPF